MLTIYSFCLITYSGVQENTKLSPTNPKFYKH